MSKIAEFDWDLWNIQKNEVKHGVSPIEAESAFYDVNLVLFEDIKHSTKTESRYILYGRSMENRMLMVGFTKRKTRIRVITTRTASKEERNVYEKEKKKKRNS